MCVCAYVCMSIKYVTLFLANFNPPPPVTLCHTSRDPPKVRHTSRTPPNKSPLVQILSKLFVGVFVREVLSEGLLSGSFCPRWFLSVPVLSEHICYIRKLNITLNFMFRMYDKKIISVTSHALYPPSPVTNCHTFSDPLPPSSVTYFMDGPIGGMGPLAQSTHRPYYIVTWVSYAS